MNIVDVIRESARARPAHPAIRCGTGAVSYGELLARVDTLAAAWRAAGMAPLQRVAFHFPDGVDYIAGSLAILATGAAVVPISPTLMGDEAGRVLAEIDVHWILAPPGGDAVWSDATFALRPRATRAEPRPGYEAIAPAFIRFTSGTTADSKGVVLSHAAIRERIDAADQALRIQPEDVVLWVLSMSFHFVVTILLYLTRGATIFLCQQPFPRALLDGIRAGGTVIYASPFHYQLLAAAGGLQPAELARVRLAVSTATKLPEAVADVARARLGLDLAEAYGIIEVGLPFVARPGDAQRAPGGLGRPLPGYDVRIDAPDADGVGEVLLRGPGMADAYFQPWRTRASYLDDGWFRTGDLGRLERDGSLCILGRLKQVINFSGMKIFPYEIEDVIARHPAVQQCRVVARPHPSHGQVPCAELVLRAGAASPTVLDDIRRACARDLAPHKQPQDLLVVNALPLTPSGKIRRA